MANLVINGDLSEGHANNWPGRPAYSASGGPRGGAHVTYPAGHRTESFAPDFFSPTIPASVLEMGDHISFSVWIKADKPNSRIFFEVRDGAGSHLASTLGGAWKVVEGFPPDANTSRYPIGNMLVPTEWTRVTATLEVRTPTPFRMGSTYFNHTNGTERDAAVSLAGLTMEVVKPVLFENWADMRFKETPGEVGSHIAYLYPAPTGTAWTLGTRSNGSEDQWLQLHFPEGVESLSARRGVLWFRPQWDGPWASSESTNDFSARPGERVHAMASVAAGGVHTGIDLRTSRISINFRTPGGIRTFGSELATILYDAQGGTVFSVTATTPHDATAMYVMLETTRRTSTGGPSTVSSSIFVRDLYIGPDTESRGGVTEVGIATTAREGLASDIYVRSREKIAVELARVDNQLIAGERVELAAFAASAADMSWRWRQITGPEVTLTRRANTAHFIAPDVNEPTPVRIACRASSVDGANSSDWHYFDLTIDPPRTRWIPEEGQDFTPRSPQMVGYDRGKREIWNDVMPPVGMDPNGRWDAVLRDLGIPADDVQFVHDGQPPARASAGGVYIDIETGDIYRNFGGGYNESDDTEGAPRLNAYMVNPATGDIFEWREEES